MHTKIRKNGTVPEDDFIVFLLQQNELFKCSFSVTQLHARPLPTGQGAWIRGLDLRDLLNVTAHVQRVIVLANVSPAIGLKLG